MNITLGYVFIFKLQLENIYLFNCSKIQFLNWAWLGLDDFLYLSAQGQSLDECLISLRVLTSIIGARDSISSRQASLLICRMLFGIQLCFGCYGMKSPIGRKIPRALSPRSGRKVHWQKKNNIVPVVGFCIFTMFCMQSYGTKINGCR